MNANAIPPPPLRSCTPVPPPLPPPPPPPLIHLMKIELHWALIIKEAGLKYAMKKNIQRVVLMGSRSKVQILY